MPVKPATDTMPGLIGRIRRLIFGAPVPTTAHLTHRLPIFLALPMFASDALSSVAYATEEILIVLAGVRTPGGGIATGYLLPLTFGIVILMLIVITSYRLAISHHAGSAAGGSYTVARENLGVYPGLVAGASLAIDYILTVAVSVSAGVAALASANANLLPYKVEIALGIVLFIALLNLRGVRESGWVLALPAYTFITSLLVLIGSSIYHYFNGTVQQIPPAHDAVVPTTALGLVVLLRAFSSGCTAMTGIEAVSNGIKVFQPPEGKNASKTLLLLGMILATLFVGIGFSAYFYGAVPTHSETLISQLARANFGGGILYYLIVYATMVILLVAASTSFAAFPQLLSMVANDGYAPRIFSQMGDKLVYNRGIYALTLLSGLLIFVFNASVTNLIPLYAVGVFLCFTLSQAGMVRRAQRERGHGWRTTAIICGIGATVTGSVAVIITEAKFLEGAWLVVLIIPLLVFAARGVKGHYDWFQRMMAVEVESFKPLRTLEPLTVITLVSDLNRGALEGLDCARDIGGNHKDSRIRALYVELVPERTERFRERWRRFVEPYVGKHVRLDVVPSPFRWLIPPVLNYITRVEAEFPGHRIIVVIPEFETGSAVTHLLHNASARRLYAALAGRPNLTIVSCRYFIRRPIED